MAKSLNYSPSSDVFFSIGYFYVMIQQILIILIFAAAVVYLGITVYKAFAAKSGCSSGCGKCGAVDFKKIEKQIAERKL